MIVHVVTLCLPWDLLQLISEDRVRMTRPGTPDRDYVILSYGNEFDLIDLATNCVLWDQECPG